MIVKIDKKEMEVYDYNGIKDVISKLEENPKENKGRLTLEFTGIKEDPIFLNKFLKGWYMGLLYNTPNLLYFLSDKRDDIRQWTDLQFAMLMFGDVQIKDTDNEFLSFEIKIDEHIFQQLVRQTAEYIMKIEEKDSLSEEEKKFFSHLIFDYTSGFHRM